MNARCILILGMHRSGTSALTRVVNLMGADLPRQLIPPKPSNTTGFWESRSLFQIHNDLLEGLGLLWYDFVPLPPDWLDHPATKKARAALLECLRRDFSGSPLFVIKDPRLCRILPLWIEVLAEFGAQPHFVFCYRNPLEVAASLLKRDGLPSDVSLPLWADSYLTAERDTRGQAREFVSYDDLLEDWRAVLTRLGRDFGLTWTRTPEAVQPEVEAFLSKGHRHHTQADFGEVRDTSTRETLSRLYAALEADRTLGGSALAAAAEAAGPWLEARADAIAPLVKFERRAYFEMKSARWNRQRRILKLKKDLHSLRSRLSRTKRFVALSLAAVLLLGIALGWGLGRFSGRPPSPAVPVETTPPR